MPTNTTKIDKQIIAFASNHKLANAIQSRQPGEAYITQTGALLKTIQALLDGNLQQLKAYSLLFTKNDIIKKNARIRTMLQRLVDIASPNNNNDDSDYKKLRTALNRHQENIQKTWEEIEDTCKANLSVTRDLSYELKEAGPFFEDLAPKLLVTIASLAGIKTRKAYYAEISKAENILMAQAIIHPPSAAYLRNIYIPCILNIYIPCIPKQPGSTISKQKIASQLKNDVLLAQSNRGDYNALAPSFKSLALFLINADARRQEQDDSLRPRLDQDVKFAIKSIPPLTSLIIKRNDDYTALAYYLRYAQTHHPYLMQTMKATSSSTDNNDDLKKACISEEYPPYPAAMLEYAKILYQQKKTNSINTAKKLLLDLLALDDTQISFNATSQEELNSIKKNACDFITKETNASFQTSIYNASKFGENATLTQEALGSYFLHHYNKRKLATSFLTLAAKSGRPIAAMQLLQLSFHEKNPLDLKQLNEPLNSITKLLSIIMDSDNLNRQTEALSLISKKDSKENLTKYLNNLEEYNNTRIKANLGACYYYHAKDKDKAVPLLIATANTQSSAASTLSRYYFSKQDKTNANKYLAIAINLGYEDAHASLIKQYPIRSNFWSEDKWGYTDYFNGAAEKLVANALSGSEHAARFILANLIRRPIIEPALTQALANKLVDAYDSNSLLLTDLTSLPEYRFFQALYKNDADYYCEHAEKLFEKGILKELDPALLLIKNILTFPSSRRVLLQDCQSETSSLAIYIYTLATRINDNKIVIAPKTQDMIEAFLRDIEPKNQTLSQKLKEAKINLAAFLRDTPHKNQAISQKRDISKMKQQLNLASSGMIKKDFSTSTTSIAHALNTLKNIKECSAFIDALSNNEELRFALSLDMSSKNPQLTDKLKQFCNKENTTVSQKIMLKSYLAKEDKSNTDNLARIAKSYKNIAYQEQSILLTDLALNTEEFQAPLAEDTSQEQNIYKEVEDTYLALTKRQTRSLFSDPLLPTLKSIMDTLKKETSKPNGKGKKASAIIQANIDAYQNKTDGKRGIKKLADLKVHAPMEEANTMISREPSSSSSRPRR